MNNPLSPNAIDFGVKLTRVNLAEWRVISVNGPLDRGGNANIYVDVLDEHWQRLADIPVRFFWEGDQFVSKTELKPGESDQGTNMPMSAGGNAYGVRIDWDGSDTVWGMGLVPFEKHKSWRVVFQRNTAITDDAPLPIDPPAPNILNKLLFIQQHVEQAIELARGNT